MAAPCPAGTRLKEATSSRVLQNGIQVYVINTVDLGGYSSQSRLHLRENRVYYKAIGLWLKTMRVLACNRGRRVRQERAAFLLGQALKEGSIGRHGCKTGDGRCCDSVLWV